MITILNFSKKAILLAIFSLTSYFLSAQTIKYVTPGGTGLKDGSSWLNAYSGGSLQTAINSVATLPGGGQVWVASGTYTLTMDSSGIASPTDARTKTLTMKKNVKIYGGFDGTEISLSARSIQSAARSIINGNSCYHVVTYNRVADTTALLDGFKITGGYANTSGSGRDIGAGIFAVGGVVANCTISNNISSYKAAGAYIDGGIIKNCLIYSNTLTSVNCGGGGLYLTSNSAPYLASNCTIYSNIAPSGAGILVDGKITGYIQNCSIYSNYANGTNGCSLGGANAGGAGIYVWGKVIISSCAIFNNTSSHMAGGIFEDYNGVKIINCTIANNQTLRSGENVNQQIYLYANTLEACTIYNSVITSVNSKGDDVIRTLTYAKSIGLINSFANGYNISSNYDLYFKSPTTDIGYNTSEATTPLIGLSNWNISSINSILFNAGDNSVLTKDLSPLDAASNPRVVMGIVDVGAFEYNTRRYVTPTGAGTKDGSNWANAYAGTSLQIALNKGFGEVFVAAGTYSPTANASGSATPGSDDIFTIPKDVMLYGSFHGNEINSSDRIRFDKNGDGKIQPWEFKDSTIFSGTSGVTQRYYAGLVRFANDYDTARIDGFILKYALSQAINVESAYSLNKILNCIVCNNGVANQNLPIVHLRGNSYMFGTYVTQSLNTNAVYTDETPLIDSCLITYSYAFSVGGPGATIKNSIIHHSPYCSWISGTFTYDHCVISEITGTPAITSTGLGYMYNSVLENCSNVGIAASNGFTMVNSVITNTTTGITVAAGEYKIINSTFAQNSTDINCPTSVGNTSYLTNSILTDSYTIGTNTIVKNCAIKGGYALGDSIISLSSYTDAKFVMPTTFSGYTAITAKISDIHWANWSLLPTSSLIDKGTNVNDNLVDINNNPRPSLGRYDIGAYEVQSIAPPMVVPTVAIVDATPIAPGNATINWYNSTADGFAVFVKDGATGVPSIIDGDEYTANTIFTNGSTPDNSWYCVYNGTGTTVTVTNLTAGNWHSIVVLPYIGKNYKVYAKYLAEGKNVIRFYEKSPQTITFTAPVEIDGQTSFIPNASTTSNYQLSFTSSDPTVALPNGSTIQILKTGTVTITASQAGNAQYFPAQSVAKTIVFGKTSQTISFTMATSATYGDADVALVASSVSGLPVTFSSSNTSVATVINGVLSIVGVGTATITANQNGNNYFTSATPVSYILTVLPKAQALTFGTLTTKTYGSSSFALTATANSGLPVTYTSSNTAIASVAGNIVTINAAGTATITASQSGNSNYSAVNSVNQLFTVNKASQTFTFTMPTTATYGDADIVLNGTTSSGLAVLYSSSNQGVASITNGVLSIKAAGTATITASVVSNANYNDATPISYTLSVSTKAQTINFGTLGTKTYGDASFALSASANSGLAVTYTSSNLSVASIAGNIVTIKSAGTATITASQPGTGNYSVATDVNQVLTVGKASQILSFTLPTIATYGDADITLNASTTSNLPVIYTSDNLNVATISNGILSIKGAGSATITASVASNTNYTDATPISYTLSISPKSQTINFGTLGTKTYGDASFALSASANSGLAVAYTSSNPSVASIAGNIVTIKSAGTATITASQTGNGNYSVATEVNQVLTVGKDSQILSFTLPTIATYGDADISLNASTTSNLPVIYTSDNLNVATISNGILTIKGAGSATITASVASNTNYSDATPISYTLSISPKAQTISFSALGTKTYGDASFALSASANSGLAVSYTSSNPSVASIAGNIVTIKAAGTATITASQTGNGNYSVATEVNQVLTVGKDSQILSFTLPTIATYGDADISLNASTTSNLPVIYTSDNLNVATISNGILTIKGAGSATITASVANNANFNDATPITYTLSVSPKAQTISFSTLGTKTYSDASFALSASANSGLAVSYSSSNPSVASIAGNIVTIKSAGTATITASQPGNGNYSVATEVNQVLTVGKDSQILSFTLPTIATYGDADIILNATTTSNLPVIYTSDNLNVATISNGILSIKGAGLVTITASVTSNTNYTDATPISCPLSVSTKAQTINFGTLETKTYGDASFALSASANSGLAVSYTSSNLSVASIAGNIVTIKSAGTATITASQVGNGNYSVAKDVNQVLTVGKDAQILSFTLPTIAMYGDADITLNASTTSNLPVIYTSDNLNVATTSNGVLSIKGSGLATITASVASNTNYSDVTPILYVLSVSPKAQSIAMDSIAIVTYGSSDIMPIVKTESNGEVSFSTNNSAVASISKGNIHINGVGSAIITATQKGTNNYLPISTSRVLTVVKSSQIISFTAPSIKTFVDSSFVLDGVSSSGLALTYTSNNPSVATILGDTVIITGAGKAIITASQIGDSLYLAANPVSRQLSVLKSDQTISFDALPQVVFGSIDTIKPVVSSSSLLPINLQSSNLGIAKIENGKIVIVGAGQANITASQAGNANFNQAAQVQLLLTVFAQAQTLSYSKIDTLVFGMKDTVLNAKASSGLPLTFSSSNPTVVQTIGSKLHIVHSGIAQISISQAGTKGIAPVDSIFTVVVKKANQSISFANISNKTFGDADFSPVVSASSGLPVELSSNDSNIVSISNGTIHIIGVGTVTIIGSQTGSENYNAANSVSHTFTIQKVSQSVVFNGLPTIIYGQKQLLLEASSSSGLPITFESSNPIIVSINGSIASILGTGSVIITAKQSGDNNTMAATNKIQTLTILKRSQIIDFATSDSVSYQKGIPLSINVTSTEGLPVSFLSSNQSVIAIQNGKPVIVGAGSIVLTALQAGNDTIAAATQVERSVTVVSKVQHITSSAIIPQSITYSLVDTALSIKTTEVLSVTLQSATPNIIQIVNNKIQTVGTGVATLHLVQAGTAGIEPLDTIIYIKVNKALQTISFATIPTKKVGMIPFKLFATSSSGQTISYTSSNSTVAEVVENEVTINNPGITSITASIVESDNYLATSISQTLVVTSLNTLKMPLYTISRDTIIDLSSLVLNNDSFSFTFVKANHILATVQNTLATISINSNDKAWIGTDTLWFNAVNTENSNDIQTLGIKVRRIPLTEEIGLVTVDSTTATNTIIAWERSKNAGIKGYIIYRGGNSKDVWDSIAYVPATEKSYFVDKNVNVNIQAYQYSMVTVDSNNLRSNRSSTHTTMHLMTGVNLQNKPQLWWTPYVGADVESYIIYRMNQTTGKLDSIGSSILTSYTDIDPESDSKDYRVGIRFSKEINPKHLKSDSGPFSVSLSNMAESELVDAPIVAIDAQVKAYPNPTSGKFTIEINGEDAHDYSIQLINTLGEIVLETKLGKFSNKQVSIDASSLSQNVYQIKIICDKKVITMPLIISE